MKKNSTLHKFILIFSLIILLLLSITAGLLFGSVSLSFHDIISGLFRQDTVSASAIIIRTVRLPRVLGGLLSGIGLAVSGVILQNVMNNALASPNTIGVNSGAGFAVMLAMLLFPRQIYMQPLFAFIGALITTFAIFLLAYLADRSRMTIILAGITISSFLSAGINLMKLLNTDLSVNITSFLIGTLSGVTMSGILYPAIGIITAFILVIFLSKALNILNLGDDIARSLGLPVSLLRFILLTLASILAGCVVSFAGLLSFVGLIIPHICRRLFGDDARILIPTSALLGSSFVILCDLIGRVAFSPYELPAGIIMAFIGGPFFLYLLLIRKGGHRVNA